MADEIKTENTTSHGSFERRDIGAAGIVYFLLGLAAAVLLIHFLLRGLYDFLDKRERAAQPAVSPLVTNVPTDTRKLPVDYRDYLKQDFPAPQLEIDERTQLNGIRLNEEQTLNSYGWVDEKAGTVRIPIERAMDLIAARGLPVLPQGSQTAAAKTGDTKKGNKQ
jgi:hypothetical protein